MAFVVLLDAGPLGMACNPNASREVLALGDWLDRRASRGAIVAVPEIADYEVRRELLRARRSRSIERLDLLKATMSFVPISSEVMLRAAELWAQARRRGQPTSDASALDADSILAAQAQLLTEQGEDAVVATTDVGHLKQFVDARPWQEISI